MWHTKYLMTTKLITRKNNGKILQAWVVQLKSMKGIERAQKPTPTQLVVTGQATAIYRFVRNNDLLKITDTLSAPSKKR